MTKIKRKSTESRALVAALAVLDALFLCAAVVFLILAVLFRTNAAPDIFAHRIYLMDTEAFSLVKKGSAIVASHSDCTDISAGNIIIFDDEEGNFFAGEVQDVKSDEGIYTFTAKNDVGEEITVGQSHILGKGVYYSELLGNLISFLTSVWGVCLVAILPCAAFIIYEIIASVRRKMPQPEVKTVKKQEETPTYIPPTGQGFSAGNNADNYGDEFAFATVRERQFEAAGLYTSKQKYTGYNSNGTPIPSVNNPVTISERDIDRLIREAKEEHTKRQFASRFDSLQEAANNAAGRIRPRPVPVQSSQIPMPPPPVVEEPAPPKPVFTELKEASKREEQTFSRPVVQDSRSFIEKITQSDLQQDIENSTPVKPAQPAEPPAAPPLAQQQRPNRTASKQSPRVSKLDSLLQQESQTNYNIDEILNRLG